MSAESHIEVALPGAKLDSSKMPGHWLLARLGKRVLRPGGLRLTRQMLDELAVDQSDAVVEFAPGLGVTAKMVIEQRPAQYTAVERDCDAAARVARLIETHGYRCARGTAESTGLEDGCASVVFGEAMLSMQPHEKKQAIAAEAARLLRPGGRYGIHELCLVPDDVPDRVKREITDAMSEAVHVGVRPLTVRDWCAMLERVDLEVVTVKQAPFHLLEPWRIVQDEGLFGALRFFKNVVTQPDARKRVLAMRRVFWKHRNHIAALTIIARRRSACGCVPV